MAPPLVGSCSSQWRSEGTPSCFRQPEEGVAVPARPGNPLRQLAQRTVNLAAIPKAPREHFHFDRFSAGRTGGRRFEGASTHVTPSLGSLAAASADSLETNVSFSATNCPLLGTVPV